MTFIRKLIDILNMGNSANNSKSKMGASKIPYPERFGEDCREVNNCKKIKFTGKMDFDIPEVQICAEILLNGNRNGDKIKSNDKYSLYFEGRYGIINISRLHQWLYEEGYLRSAALPEALSLYKVSELKMVLESLGLKKTGNKADLIDRVIDAIDDDEKARIIRQCEHLFVTEKGLAFLEENEDYAMYHKKSYSVTFEEFNKHRILQGRKRRFYDTIFQALSEKAFSYQYKQWFSKLEMIYFNLSEVLYDEGRYDLALQNTLFRLYFSTNLASHPYYFNIEHVKYDGLKKIKEHIIACNDVFFEGDLKKIVELKEYYSEHMLDVVYGYHILPYTIFEKPDLADVIQNLLNGIRFDAKHYMNYICERYENYIKQFI